MALDWGGNRALFHIVAKPDYSESKIVLATVRVQFSPQVGMARLSSMK